MSDEIYKACRLPIHVPDNMTMSEVYGLIMNTSGNEADAAALTRVAFMAYVIGTRDAKEAYEDGPGYPDTPRKESSNG